MRFPFADQRTTTVAYCKRLHYIYELSLKKREVEEDGERQKKNVGRDTTMQRPQHVYICMCINRDRGRRRRTPPEAQVWNKHKPIIVGDMTSYKQMKTMEWDKKKRGSLPNTIFSTSSSIIIRDVAWIHVWNERIRLQNCSIDAIFMYRIPSSDSFEGEFFS